MPQEPGERGLPAPEPAQAHDQAAEGQAAPPVPAKPWRRYRFLLAWVAASAGGWILGLLLGSPPLLGMAIAEAELSPSAWAAMVSLPVALAGLMACLGQGLVLRRGAPGAHGWGFAGSAACILAGPVIAAPLALLRDSDRQLLAGGFVVALLASGAMIGATQWLVVQGRASRAGRWIAASAVGWGLGTILPLIGIYLAVFDWGAAGLVGGVLLAASGAAAGHAITGAALARSLREPPTRPVKRRRTVLLVGVLWLLFVAGALAILIGR